MKKIDLKNKKFLIGGAVLIVILIVAVIVLSLSGSKDALKFKSEYEKLNGVEVSNGNVYQTMKIDRRNKVKYATLDEARDFLVNETGLIYFGMPECPWCRGVIPTLFEEVKKSSLKNILYVDVKDLRNTYSIVDDKPVETKKASQAYYDILSILDKYLDNYKVQDDDGVEHVLQEKRLYVPMVVAVREGKVVDAHIGSVDLNSSQTPYDELSAVQKSELSIIFNRLIDSLSKDKDACDGHC